jgi:phenylalanyl-tRNA synthetase beta chain
MRINIDWLRDWVDIEVTPEELAEQLTLAGLEVDAVLPVAGQFEGVVVARVETVEPHPGADRLRLCKVDDGTSLHDVVCGAPNVAPGVVVPFARVGARLPSGDKIKAAKLRGAVSNGMLCSARELELSDDASGLLLLAADAPIGATLRDHLRLDDAVLDIDLTPNRGDCFSVLGIAREVAARSGMALHGPEVARVPPKTDAAFPVRLEAPAACPRFAGRVIRGVRNDVESPLWLRERLRRAGLRAISPLVDVTNYVMLELGQPLHAYDLALLREEIIVRQAVAGEELVLLNEQSVELTEDVLVIADTRGAIGLAGIMGGASTATTQATRDVFLESAYFAPEGLVGRARRFGLHTDASLRFERGVDPSEQVRAIERATELLLDIGGGQAGPTQMTADATASTSRASIPLRAKRIDAVLGVRAERETVEVMLTRLGMKLSPTKDGWDVVPPAYRFDLTLEEDLIEEVGRMLGYDSIPARPAYIESVPATSTEAEVSLDLASDVLVDRGYHEIVTYSFIDRELEAKIIPGRESIELSNPISSDLSSMRQSLWPGLLRAAQRNVARQHDDLRLFEAGPQYRTDLSQASILAGLATGRVTPGAWDGTARNIDFFDVKADVEAVLGLVRASEEFRFESAGHPALRPGQSARITRGAQNIGWIGALHPMLENELEFRAPVYLFALRTSETLATQVPKFTGYSRFPSIRRDIAVVVDDAVTAEALHQVVRQSAGPLLESVLVFDVYRGEGIDATRKSVALGLILQDASRTLTDEDADQVVASVTDRLTRDLGAIIRT